MIPLYAIANGGEGSGNFGHEGRPGEVGGSAPSGSASPKVKEWAEQKFGAEKGKAFSDWFAGSKVVNEKGEPLVVYHGTNADFSVFDLDKKESSTFSRPGVENHYFFTPIKERANFYSGAHGEQGANVMPVFLHIKKPLIKEMSDANTGDVTNAIGDAIAGGHDGLILKWKQKRADSKKCDCTMALSVLFLKEQDGWWTTSPTSPSTPRKSRASGTRASGTSQMRTSATRL